MLTFRLAVVHSLPSAIRLDDAIVPDRFWSFGERLPRVSFTWSSCALRSSWEAAHSSGGGISTWLGRTIASLLYGIQPHDALTMASSVLTLAVVGTLAAWLPAWRASGLDPADVLRES